jgi:Transcriptional regulators
MDATDDLALVDGIRAFNRFYTDRIGVLDRAYLKGDYTLTEARVLYEVGARNETSASDLVRDLRLDPAYLSRILKTFRDRDLVTVEKHPIDRRSQILKLTSAGRAEFKQLGELSRAQIRDMLSRLTGAEREALAAAMDRIPDLIGDRTDRRSAVLRPHRPGDLGWIIQSQTEFYAREFGWHQGFEALVSRVAAEFLEHFDPTMEQCWIAERSGLRLGSVMIVNGGDGVAKLRLLYVDAAARGLGLGRLLVEQSLAFARQAGYRKVSLWTNDILHAARHIYLTLGFTLVSEERHKMFGPELNGQTWELDL